jgi:Sulfotransferase family
LPLNDAQLEVEMGLKKAVALLFLCGIALRCEAVDESKLFQPLFPRYNFTASDQQKFVWFRVAKVGTRTMSYIFKNNANLSVKRPRSPYDALKYKKYFKFAFVRNPWDRVVSCYCNKVITKKHPTFKGCYGQSFEYFVDFLDRQDLSKGDVHIRLQTKLFPVDEVDFIGRFENFSKDLNYVLKTIGIDENKIPNKNKSSHKHYSKYYNERTKAIIERKYKADIEAFGYRFETK